MPLITHAATTTTTIATATAAEDITNVYPRPEERTIHCHNTAKRTAQINQQHQHQQQQQPAQQQHNQYGRQHNHHQNPLGFTRIHCTSRFLRSNNESPLIHSVPSTPVTGENPVVMMHLHDCTTPSPSPSLSLSLSPMQSADDSQYKDFTRNRQQAHRQQHSVSSNDDGDGYIPPYDYGQQHVQHSLSRCSTLRTEHVMEKAPVNDLFLESSGAHQRDFSTYSYGQDDDDSSSLAMITPPPPYDTQTASCRGKDDHRGGQAVATVSPSSSALTANKKNTRQYLFFNNREMFNIGSLAGGGSGVGSIAHKGQQPAHSSSHFASSGNAMHSLGSAFSNAITPTKLSAAAAAMFAAPQLNRKWTHLSRKRRRRHHGSNDCKELDKLVLKSVDWDDTDIY